jgi:Holliday junction resolvase RusA-like endonuclease
MIYPIKPMAKPRMTRSDKWKQRACVVRYRAFKDECKRQGLVVHDSVDVTYVVPMPASWSAKKRAQMSGRPHQQKPDLDNFDKALLDAVFIDDSHVWQLHSRKVWGEQGSIMISPILCGSDK